MVTLLQAASVVIPLVPMRQQPLVLVIFMWLEFMFAMYLFIFRMK